MNKWFNKHKKLTLSGSLIGLALGIYFSIQLGAAYAFSEARTTTSLNNWNNHAQQVNTHITATQNDIEKVFEEIPRITANSLGAAITSVYDYQAIVLEDQVVNSGYVSPTTSGPLFSYDPTYTNQKPLSEKLLIPLQYINEVILDSEHVYLITSPLYAIHDEIASHKDSVYTDVTTKQRDTLSSFLLWESLSLASFCTSFYLLSSKSKEN